jgi:hypothetical protein
MLNLNVNTNGDLELTASPDLLLEDLDRLRSLNTMAALGEMLETYLCNGWDWINPEDIYALTDAPIIGHDVVINDDGSLVSFRAAWYHHRYQTENAVEMLISGETVVWQLISLV